jgi:glycosyltransferase involved in cell wall biosynthesis
MRKERFGALKLRLLKQFAGILAISDGIAEDYYQHDFPSDQVHVQMNCLDTALFHPAESLEEKLDCRCRFDLPEDARVCLFVGSLIRRKGVDLLVDAFITAHQRDQSLFLWLVGPKDRQENPTLDEDFVRGLQEKVSKLGLDESVRFEGIVNDRTLLAEAYRAADLFVFPSRKEGLPNVVLEAMASGLSVIVSELPGLKQVVLSGQNGIMINIESEGSFAEAMGELCQNPALAEKLSQRARKYILVHHSFAAWQDQLADYYQELIDREAK